MKSSPLSFASAAAVLAFTSAPALHAQVNTAAATFASELGRWNAILNDDFNFSNSHSQSGIAVGDTATLSNSADLNQTSAFNGNYAFRVYGQLVLAGSANKSLNSSAAVVQNGTTNVGLKDYPVNNGDQRVLSFHPTNPNVDPRLVFNGNNGDPAPVLFLNSADSFFSSRYTSLSTASSIFDAAAGLAPINNGFGKLTFTAPANGNATVFDWNVGLQGSINEVELIAPVNSNLIINVINAGSLWTPTINMVGQSSGSASRVLWNLAGGLDLTTNRQWHGSILGPDSSIIAGEHIDGQIFSEDLTMNDRELHFVQFAAIPEPSTYAMILSTVAFAFTAVIRLRRQVAKC